MMMMMMSFHSIHPKGKINTDGLRIFVGNFSFGLCGGSLSVVSVDVGWAAVSGMLSASVCIKPILLGDTESRANDLPGC